jgi:hypothetical protein
MLAGASAQTRQFRGGREFSLASVWRATGTIRSPRRSGSLTIGISGEQVSDLREQLAGLLEHEEEWEGAAKALMGIPLESGHRRVVLLPPSLSLNWLTTTAI